MPGIQSSVPQFVDAARRQTIQAAPVLVMFRLRQLAKEVAQQPLPLTLAPLQLLGQTRLIGPESGIVRAREGRRFRQREPGGSHLARAVVHVEMLGPLAATDDQRQQGCAFIRGQRGGQPGGIGFEQRIGQWIDHINNVQHRPTTEQGPGPLQVSGHGLTPAGQRQQQTVGRGPFAGDQHRTQDQFPHRGHLIRRAGVHPPDPQFRRIAQPVAPGGQVRQRLGGLWGIGGDHPDRPRLRKHRCFLAQAVAARMVAVEIEPFRGDEAENFRDDRPGRAQGAEQNGWRFDAGRNG